MTQLVRSASFSSSMLAFVIPLKSRRASYSWSQTCNQYRNCLRALENQTARTFQILTVCHDIPNGVKENDHHHILRSRNPDPCGRLKRQIEDQRQKILEGIQWVHCRPFTHMMVVDADDLISNRLAGFVASNTQSNGWVLNHGYHWRSWTKRIRLWSNFHEFCGSSVILSKEICGEFLQRYPQPLPCDYAATLHHTHAAETVESWGFPLKPLPFPGGIYVYTPWENLSYRRRYFWLWAFKRWRRSRPQRVALTPAVSEEFSLPAT